MKILFICKANKFRSKIAEAWFKKLNKNKHIKTDSAGLIPGKHPPDENVKKIAGKYGLKLTNKRKGLSTELLKWQDMIVIVANDVPPSIFSNEKHGKKLEVWKIPDTRASESEKINRIIRLIHKKVIKLVKELAS